MSYGDIWLILTGLALLVAAYVYRAKNVKSYNIKKVFNDSIDTNLDFVCVFFLATVALIAACFALAVIGALLLVCVDAFYTLLNSL